MSKQRKKKLLKGRNQRKDKMPLNAMADALMSAGVVADKKVANNVDQQPKDQSDLCKSESQLWQDACEGAEKAANNGQRILNFQSKQEPHFTHKNQPHEGTKSNVYLRVGGNEEKISAASNGGTYSSRDGLKKASSNIQPAPIENLIVTPDSSINKALLLCDDQHFYTGELFGESDFIPKTQAEGEIDLVIGLDFGTTYCKAVVQEPDSGRAWAIPFTTCADNPYILATSILHDEGFFRLYGDGESIGNLKVPLLTGKEMPPGHALNVIAFFALVIRHIKRWVEINKSDELAGLSPFWSVNMGLPAKDLERSEMVDNFTRLIWAGMALSDGNDSAVTKKEAANSFLSAYHAMKSGAEFIPKKAGGELHKEQVGIFPEIAAQIYGYLKSDMWDRSQNMFLLIDVGGGTVDGAVFRVVESDDGKPNFIFLKSSVKQLGVYILHQKRLAWHLSQLERNPDSEELQNDVRELIEKDATLGKIPGAIDEYLTAAKYPKTTQDNEFYEKFRKLAWEELIQDVRGRINIQSQVWTKLPFLLCGGGRSIGLYKDFLRLLNKTNSSTQVKLHEIGMRKPSSLEGAGLGEAEYQRISVAYGLSFYEIGDVVTPDKLKEPENQDTPVGYRASYISQEMV